MKYCPNCSAELDDQASVSFCPNCQASFGPASAWRPTDAPVGEFRRFKRVEPKAKEVHAPAGPMNPFGEVLLRLFIGGIGCVILGVLAVLSAVPYGGRSDFVSLFLLSPLLLVIWALFPLQRLFKKNGKTGHDNAS